MYDIAQLNPQELKELVSQALINLGATVDEVIASLKAKEIKGNHSSTSCPIARYLSSLFTKDGEPVEIPVGTGSIHYHGHVNDACLEFYLELPPAVKEFIEGFDNHADGGKGFEKFAELCAV